MPHTNFEQVTAYGRFSFTSIMPSFSIPLFWFFFLRENRQFKRMLLKRYFFCHKQVRNSPNHKPLMRRNSINSNLLVLFTVFFPLDPAPWILQNSQKMHLCKLLQYKKFQFLRSYITHHNTIILLPFFI